MDHERAWMTGYTSINPCLFAYHHRLLRHGGSTHRYIEYKHTYMT